MTLAEIYNEVVRLVYGDLASPPPVHEQVEIQQSILKMHHDVQQDYNYWFMFYRSTLSLVSGVDTYALPTRYKQLDYLEVDVMPVIINDIYFEDGITETKDVKFYYWKFITTPAWTDTYTDDVTTNLHWAIIYAVVADIALKRLGQAEAQFYILKRDEIKERVQQEDYARRQHHKQDW